jgi:hypothetical protein
VMGGIFAFSIISRWTSGPHIQQVARADCLHHSFTRAKKCRILYLVPHVVCWSFYSAVNVYTISSQVMINWKGFGRKKLCYDQDANATFFWKCWGEQRKSCLDKWCLIKIWTDTILSTNPEYYWYINHLGRSIIHSFPFVLWYLGTGTFASLK